MPRLPLPDHLLHRADLWVGGEAAHGRAQTTGHAALDRLLPGGGWPRGALSEILVPEPGVGELRLILPLLIDCARAGQRVALVSPPHLPYAPGLAKAGLRLEQCWIAEPESATDRVWVMEQMLRCPAVGAVAAWLDRTDERVQRRLQLAAERENQGAGAIGLLLLPPSARHQASVAALRLALTPLPEGPQVEVLKSRGGRVGQTARLAA